MSIVASDWDEATYYGDEDDGVYVNVGQGPDGKWYMTATVDCNTASFVDDLVTDDGPYDTEEEAKVAGKDAAIEWCHDNDVDYENPDEADEA
jgi:hypothetical protein